MRWKKRRKEQGKKMRKKEYNYDQPSPIPLLPLLPMTERPPMPQLPSLSLQIYYRHLLRISIVATILYCGLTSLLQVSCLLILIITITMLIVYYSLLQTSWPMSASIIVAAFIRANIIGTVLLLLLRIIITLFFLSFACAGVGGARSLSNALFFSGLQNRLFITFLFSRHL